MHSTILPLALDLLHDLEATGHSSEVLDDLLLDLHASGPDGFDAWCPDDLPLALDSARADLKLAPWAWKQLVDSVRSERPGSGSARPRHRCSDRGAFRQHLWQGRHSIRQLFDTDLS